jgi:single-stranded DNA-specific DHH superfamily exonuclease
MLNKKQLEEIREHLEKAQNPLFFFDNDVDGLCSFILLKRAIDRGKGVAIKSFPDLSEMYAKKVEELNSDYVFILDKPSVSEEFIDKVMERNVPIVWIDHHNTEISKEIKDKVYYYNSFPSGEPTTFIAQNVFNRKQDIWLAIIGCIGDHYSPEFGEKYGKENPEFYKHSKDSFDAVYTSELGKISMMLNFGLKDTTTNVLEMIKLLSEADSPTDILEENSKTKNIHYKYNKMIKQLHETIKKAKRIGNKLILLEYSGETSMSSEISNLLSFNNQDKFVLVIFKKQDVANVSIRAKNAKEVLEKAMKGILGATGGGHDEACGARIPSSHLEEFKERIENLVG